jgi:hypothetical protein
MGTFTKFCAKTFFCEKGDEITRFDVQTYVISMEVIGF